MSVCDSDSEEEEEVAKKKKREKPKLLPTQAYLCEHENTQRPHFPFETHNNRTDDR